MLSGKTKKYIQAMKSNGLEWEQVCDIAYEAEGRRLNLSYEEVFEYICHLYGKVYRITKSGELEPITE